MYNLNLAFSSTRRVTRVWVGCWVEWRGNRIMKKFKGRKIHNIYQHARVSYVSGNYNLKFFLLDFWLKAVYISICMYSDGDRNRIYFEKWEIRYEN